MASPLAQPMAGIPRVQPLPQPGTGLSSDLSTRRLFSHKGIFQPHFELPHKATGYQGLGTTRFSPKRANPSNLCPPITGGGFSSRITPDKHDTQTLAATSTRTHHQKVQEMLQKIKKVTKHPAHQFSSQPSPEGPTPQSTLRAPRFDCRGAPGADQQQVRCSHHKHLHPSACTHGLRGSGGQDTRRECHSQAGDIWVCPLQLSGADFPGARGGAG